MKDWTNKMYFGEMMQAFAAKEIHKAEVQGKDGQNYVLTPSARDGVLSLYLRVDKKAKEDAFLSLDSYPLELLQQAWQVYHTPRLDVDPDSVSYEEMIQLGKKGDIVAAFRIDTRRSYRFEVSTVKVCEPGTEPAMHIFLLSDVLARWRVEWNPNRIKYDEIAVPIGAVTFKTFEDVTLDELKQKLTQLGLSLNDFPFIIGRSEMEQRIIMENGVYRDV